MAKRSEKDQVLADYSDFLKALLPQTEGFFCHDRQGRLFWFDEAGLVARVAEDAGYRQVLQQTLQAPDTGTAKPVRAADLSAYVLSLDDGSGAHHGALTLVLPARENIPFDFVLGAIKPALSTLQRELSLRYRLMESQRKLAVQSAEEKLLHHVESLVHQRGESAQTLTRILNLCREYLSVAEAGLVIPGKKMALLQCDGRTEAEARMRLDDLAQREDAVGTEDPLVLPVGGQGESTCGKLILAGWQQSGFSGRRRRRLARYIASHIESVVERDFDALTGLLSWPLFEARLVAACSGGQVDQQHLLLYLDVDQLHVINENYGRPVGDEVLSRFALILETCLQDWPASRISSDSFAVLLPANDSGQARLAAENICARFAEVEFNAAGKSFRGSVSIGIAPLTADHADAAAVLSEAQVACRAAKDRGAGRVEIYEPTDQSIVRRMEDIQLVGHVKEAIEKDLLVLMGQPIRALNSGSSCQYQEVLVRMQDEQGGLVEPAEFLSAAERYQLMQDLDRWVVSRSLDALKTSGMMEQGTAVRLAINLSGQSLGDEKFLQFVREQIRSSGVAPQLLCFEITETVAVANMQRAQAFMHALKKMGCRFSLDDFGTGLSSFAYLKLFPVDTLKIDGSFVRDVATNKVSQSVVAAISEVARVMELETVAEFVQDDESLALLRDLGVHWGQGYLLGEPAPLADQLSGQAVFDTAGRQSGAGA